MLRSLSRRLGSTQTSLCSSSTRPVLTTGLLAQLLSHVEGSAFGNAAELAEKTFMPPLSASHTHQPQSATHTPLIEAVDMPHHARDVVSVMLRVYTQLGKMDRIRQLMGIAVEELTPFGLLNASIFDHYLELLLKRKRVCIEEVRFVLGVMKSHEIPRTPHTWLFLVELHIRCGWSPQGVWQDMMEHIMGISDPSAVYSTASRSPFGGSLLTATVRAMFLHVFPVTTDQRFAREIIIAMLQTGKLERQHLVEAVIHWMGHPDVAPEHALWLLFELEQRCVLERASLVSDIQKQHVAQLLLRCSRCGDCATAEKLLGLMDRHVMAKTMDVLALAVACFAQAESFIKALDAVELMGRKGFLEQCDIFKPVTLDVVHHTMDRHYLVALADVLSQREESIHLALQHLKQRRAEKRSVCVASLDVVVLAWAKRGNEEKVVEMLGMYVKEFGLQPRTQSYNCALLASSSFKSTGVAQRRLFEEMITNAISPNGHTFRVLIRHAVGCSDMDDAIRYLELVGTFPNLRMEIEMVLPVLECAARAGDVATANRVSKFALDSDLGVDVVVMRNVIQLLAEHGCSTAVLEEHVPLHDALRSRSKAARRRTKYDVGL